MSQDHDVKRSRAGPRPSQTILSDTDWIRIQHRLGLTNRQLQIVKHQFDGDSEVRIARLLGIKHSTVHTHVRRMYEKLGVSDQRELLVRVFAEHLSPE